MSFIKTNEQNFYFSQSISTGAPYLQESTVNSSFDVKGFSPSGEFNCHFKMYYDENGTGAWTQFYPSSSTDSFVLGQPFGVGREYSKKYFAARLPVESDLLRIDVSCSVKYGTTDGFEIDFDNFDISVETPKIRITDQGLIFYNGPDSHITFQRNEIIIKGNEAEYQTLNVDVLNSEGRLNIKGDASADGNICIKNIIDVGSGSYVGDVNEFIRMIKTGSNFQIFSQLEDDSRIGEEISDDRMDLVRGWRVHNSSSVVSSSVNIALSTSDDDNDKCYSGIVAFKEGNDKQGIYLYTEEAADISNKFGIQSNGTVLIGDNAHLLSPVKKVNIYNGGLYVDQDIQTGNSSVSGTLVVSQSIINDYILKPSTSIEVLTSSKNVNVNVFSNKLDDSVSVIWDSDTRPFFKWWVSTGSSFQPPSTIMPVTSSLITGSQIQPAFSSDVSVLNHGVGDDSGKLTLNISTGNVATSVNHYLYVSVNDLSIRSEAFGLFSE